MMIFWTIFGAVMGANLMTFVFVWGCVAYTKHERMGTAGSKSSNGPLAAILVPLVVLLLAFWLGTDSVPAWLEAIAI
jgi:hypothetical protein